MEPVPEAAAAYIKRHPSPDGRAVLELVRCFHPDDFRELGGQQRPRIYDAVSGKKILDLVRFACGVRAFAWSDDSELTLVMEDGSTMRASLVRDRYALSTEDWAPHPLAAMQAHAERVLPLAPVGSDEPAPRLSPRLQRVGMIVLAVIVVIGALLVLRAGGWHYRYVYIPRRL